MRIKIHYGDGHTETVTRPENLHNALSRAHLAADVVCDCGTSWRYDADDDDSDDYAETQARTAPVLAHLRAEHGLDRG